MFEIVREALLDTWHDGIRLLPFLFLTYLGMEFLEHHTGGVLQGKIRRAGRSGPVWGALLGIVPQCGFSAAASSFYAGRVITLGTLMAVYLSTSDEMLPILISNEVAVSTIARILAAKVAIAMVSGLAIEAVYVHILHRHEAPINVHAVCEEEHCHCENGIVRSALQHTLQIFCYILVISFVLNAIVAKVGEQNLAALFSTVPVVGELTAALVGLVPNCASSVVITELYLKEIISPGAMMAGLLANAGVGLLVLVRLNRNWRQNLNIIALLYTVAVVWGIVIEIAGIVF